MVDWFTFAKSNLVYDGFESPHLRHQMAEQACKGTLWYRDALANVANPAAALPSFFAWLKATWWRGRWR